MVSRLGAALEAYRTVNVVGERPRRRLEPEGVPSELLPPLLPPPSVGSADPLALTLSIAETLRRRQKLRAEGRLCRTKVSGQAEMPTDIYS